MLKAKIFKSHINEITDTNNLELNLKNFIKNKKIINIKQSLVPEINETNKTSKQTKNLYFIAVTVIYEES